MAETGRSGRAPAVTSVDTGLVDTDRYPLDAADAFVSSARDGLRADGVAILDGFLRAEVVDEIVGECDALAPQAHHSVTLGTPYLGLPEDGYAAGHPRRAEVRSSLAAVAYDLFPPESRLRSLYESDPFLDLVRRMLGREVLHRYADPLGALNVAVMRDGDELGWHFDMTDFVVSIALQSSDEGGDFESATRVRSATDESYAAVTDVLASRYDPAAVASVPMRPGTLMLFEGRYSMHRVTPIRGPVPRYVALLAYDTKPDTDSSELLKLVRYGRLP
jgi:hypothetical protein